jgi:hypothetical protein
MAEVKQNAHDQVFIKQHLVNQIDNIKNDIQSLLDKKRNLTDKTEISNCIDQKQKKMAMLKCLNDKLKDLNNKERIEIQKRNELRYITRAIDNIHFGAAKKKNNSLAMDKAKQAKAERDSTRIKFREYEKMEQKYLEYDSKNVPGCLFLHKDVLKSYGLCPYLDIDLENPLDSLDVEKNRLEWLASMEDKGLTYFSLCNNLLMKEEVTELLLQKKTLENDILDYIISLLTPSQFEYYNNSDLFIQEYNSCNVKTKRLKERFRTMINWLSILYSETDIEFHKYLSNRYNLQVVVNIIESKDTTKQFTNMEKLQRSISVERFTNYLEKYSETNDLIDKKQKFCMNTLKNLKLDFYSYLTDRQNFLNRQDIPSIKRLKISQEGKYYKKWSQLTDDERFERFKSFSVYYIDKNLIDAKLLDKGLRDVKINELEKLLTESFRIKQLVYKNITWNIKLGFIEVIKILKYNDDNTFSLLKNKTQQECNTTSTNVNTNSTDTNSTNIYGQPISNKKKVSSRTIITKESEKIINEELLYFILKRVNNGTVEVTKEDKEKFAERIKMKLKIKKITVNDKIKIFEKYDEIFDVVVNNK